MTLEESQRTFRDRMVGELKRELFGPSPYDSEDVKTEVLEDSPLQLYSTGVLFPQRVHQNLLEDDCVDASAEEDIETEHSTTDMPSVSLGSGNGAVTEGDGFPEAQPLNLANEFSPSAIGITFRLAQPENLVAKISCGVYSRERRILLHPSAGRLKPDGTPFPETRAANVFVREPIEAAIPIDIEETSGPCDPVSVPGTDSKLKIHAIVRHRREDGSIVVSVMAVNENANENSVSPSVEDAFFQVGLEISSSGGDAVFLPVDQVFGHDREQDYEQAKIDLLYRHRRSFALGHGSAGDWNRDELLSEQGATNCVKTSTIPSYEMRPVKPREHGYGNTSLDLSMRFLAVGQGSSDPSTEIIDVVEVLTADYEHWLKDCYDEARNIEPRLSTTAERNLQYCAECLARMKEGISILKSDPVAMMAFRLANWAMLMQQVRTSALKSRKLGSPFPSVSDDYGAVDEKALGKDRSWRPFQLAFILINIAGTANSEHSDRSVVDLIWFPTGGGKTEAYLGLAAFTICLERLRNPGASGTQVLMRYTLRLLTAQQFQRASALIVALEVMRRKQTFGAKLGHNEISIGLWVGQSLSPNKRSEAVNKLNKMRSGRAQNPFQVLECPWCKLEFNNREKFGYCETRAPNSNHKTVSFCCPGTQCEFSSKTDHLPVYVVDEDIYERPPTLLLGTVDKFAQVAWDQRVGRLFGIGTEAPPPSLVIQDELHLISGPLGTIVGLYETVIDRLCARNGTSAKIIASTATVKKASEQCRALYDREIFEFPPQGLKAGESYFAYEDSNAVGRLYVGVFGSAVKSHQTSLVRTCSSLLQSPRVADAEQEHIPPEVTDPYGTLVWYFNSLRELGHAATLCTGDIPEYLKSLCRRMGIAPGERRFIREVIEMTSRRTADEIPKILRKLENMWVAGKQETWPVDVLLATNMISVGVDVDRLGLMVLSGQTKGTSEYIQASSRVGRRYPGLVVCVYAQTKSRDRSHYESFVAYHQSIYKHVEPTSVTPFSPQARERALRGVLVALARLDGGMVRPDDHRLLEELKPRLIETIISRQKNIDQDEEEDTRAELEEWIDQWIATTPSEYGRMAGAPDTTTLAYPYGGTPHGIYQREAWPILTSMRSVDGTAEAIVLNRYPADDQDREGAD